MNNELIETWEINARINIYLLESIENEGFNDLSASKGRNLGEQFAHIHNVRLMWLKSAAPELLEGLEKLEKGMILSKEDLHKELTASAQAITKLLEKSIENGGKVKGFKPHVTAFVGYLVSHESHHRGQIMLTLKQSGRKISKSITFGLWEWGVR